MKKIKRMKRKQRKQRKQRRIRRKTIDLRPERLRNPMFGCPGLKFTGARFTAPQEKMELQWKMSEQSGGSRQSW